MNPDTIVLLEALKAVRDFIKRAHGGEGMSEDERWALLKDAEGVAQDAINMIEGNERPGRF